MEHQSQFPSLIVTQSPLYWDHNGIITWMLELPEQCEREEHQISYLSVSKQGPEDVNRVYKKPGRPNGQQKSKGNKQEKHCNSCGSSGHLGGDPTCPARDQTCRKCK